MSFESTVFTLIHILSIKAVTGGGVLRDKGDRGDYIRSPILK